MASSILWYDLETFGINPSYDRITQFACIRTNEELEEIEDPIKLYCKPSLDYLPSPQACLVHGITPQVAHELGETEYNFAKKIHFEFSQPGTTVAGFNSINFDDEFIRFLFFRNLFDPYEREYANENSRWDIINLVRATHDLRPEGIVWPKDNNGMPVFKLEALTKANGLDHFSAHDALGDIRATIAVAKLIRTRQRKLYDWYFSHRKRESLKPVIDLPSRKMLLHTSSEYTTQHGCTTLLAPIGMDQANKNQLIAIDLRYDPERLLDLSAEEIRKLVFTKATELDEPRVPLVRIKLNHCPFLAPERVLSAEAAQRLGINRDECSRRADLIRGNPNLIQKLQAVFEIPMEFPSVEDPEASLYSGNFIPKPDRSKLKHLHELLVDPEKAEVARNFAQRSKFSDDRIPRLLLRFFARNFPETLKASERLKWRNYCAQKIQLPPAEGSAELADYRMLIQSFLDNPELPAPKRAVVHSLLDWKSFLEKELLAYDESALKFGSNP